MTYNNITDMAGFIGSSHTSFAGRPAEEALGVLGELVENIAEFPAMVGANFEARTDDRHGNIRTVITVTKLPGGSWDYTERRYDAAKKMGLV